MTVTRASSATAALLLSGLTFLGCADKKQTTLAPPPPAPTTQNTMSAAFHSDARERIQSVVARAEEYEKGAASLPGPNEADDRAQIVKQLELLGQILPVIAGPDTPGDFRQELRILDSTRAQLATGSADLAVEPTIDTGLRAAHRAINALAQRSFNDLPDVIKALDVMRAKNEELDGVSGPLHRLVAAQSLQASAQAVTQMASSVDKRLNDTKPASSEPKPVTSAAEAPKAAETAKPANPAKAAAEAPKPADPATPAAAVAPAAPAEPAKPAEAPKPADPTKDLNK
jgi:hypothetical protein